MDLVEFETIKNLLGLSSSSETAYPDLAILIESVNLAIEDELGRSLDYKERTETVMVGTSPTRFIDLVGLPIVSVSSVLVDDEALDSDAYKISPAGIRLATQVREVDVVVTYTGGILTSAIPPALQRAAMLQTAYEYQNKENIGASSISTEGGSVQIPALQLLPVVVSLISGYKHPSRIS